MWIINFLLALLVLFLVTIPPALIMSYRENRRRTAAHEAGHAVVGWHLPVILKVKEIEIRASPFKADGCTRVEFDHDAETCDHCWQAVVMFMAGLAGEYFCLDEANPDDCGTDHARARDAIDELVRRCLFECATREPCAAFRRRPTGAAALDVATAFRCQDTRAGEILNAAFARAFQLIEENSDVFSNLTQRLLVKETIDATELEAVLGPRPDRE